MSELKDIINPLAINKDDPEAIYKQIIRQVENIIKSGMTGQSARLPDERHLAQRLQVSRMTVNKAYTELHRRGLITRIRKKGTFIGKKNSQALKSGTVTLMLPQRSQDTVWPIEGEYLQGFEIECSDSRFRSVISYFDENEEFPADADSLGTAVIASSFSNSVNYQYPTVLIMGWLEGQPVADWVHTDNEDGGRLAAEHLISLGHKRLACYTQAYWHRGIDLRIRHFQKTIRRAGLEMNENFFPRRDKALSLDKIKRILKKPDRPTAFFCTSDSGGLQIISAAQEAGLNVPKDLSVISFDGTSLATLTSPSLTTVTANRIQTGQRAAELLIGRIRGTVTGPPKEVITPVRLEVRNSTGPAPL